MSKESLLDRKMIWQFSSESDDEIMMHKEKRRRWYADHFSNFMSLASVHAEPEAIEIWNQ